MPDKNKKEKQIMNVADLRELLSELVKESKYNFQIWLSSDEEGNEFLPMLKNTEFCLCIDEGKKRIIFFPAHR